jgi:GDP-mannose transporter
MISATSFTLVGVVNKFLTVLLNVIVWDKHSTPLGITAVCLCLLAGVFYQQAPRRDEVHRSPSPKRTPRSGSGEGVEMASAEDTEPLMSRK